MINDTIVKCNVDTCKHNKSHNCCLNVLNISCVCDSQDCHKKSETICNNFSKRKD